MDFKFKVYTGPLGGWGSPDSYYKGSTFTATATSGHSHLVAKGPITVGTYCCNSIVRKNDGPQSANGGSFDAFMSNAAPGRYRVFVQYIGKASITGSQPMDRARADLTFGNFTGQSILSGNVTANYKDSLTWGETAVGRIVYVDINSSWESVNISHYNVIANLNGCGPLTVTADGTIEILSWEKIQ